MNGEVVSVPKIDIRPDYWEIVQGILRKHVPEYEVWAFGSRAKWTAKEYSDLDLAIVSDHPVSLDVIAALADEFSESELPWKVDVVDWATTSESFRKIIERDRVVVQKGGGATRSGWFETTIGEQVTLQRGFDITRAEQRAGTVPVVSSGGVSSYHDTSAVKGPGVVLGRKGVVGSVHFIAQDFWPHDTTLWVKDFRGNDARFVYYFFRAMAPQLAALDVGSANPTLNRNHVHPLRTVWPALPLQRQIAAVLSVLDDCIDLLRQTNATLESIAQVLFKSWFIDFDPVRAKAEGREPEGMDAETAALFPNAFEESALGVIPKGWSVRSLDSLATYLNGLALQKFPPEGDDEYLPVIKIAQLRAGNTVGADRASARLKSEYVVHDGDVLFSWSGSLEVEVWCGGDGALNQHLFKVTSNEVPKWFYYLATRNFLPRFREIAAHKATTMGHIQRKHLTEARIALPTQHLVSKLGELMSPIVERRIANSLQVRELGAIRDTLLPRLISGKLRLPEAEAKLNEALA